MKVATSFCYRRACAHAKSGLWPLLTCVAFSLALMLTTASAQMLPERGSGFTIKQAVRAPNAMVAAAHPLAVEAGYAMLKKGGSAVDAAIATQLALNVVEPQSSGIGGGAFMLVHRAATNTLAAYDGRETAPLAAKPDRFIGSDGKPITFHEAVVGGKSVATPGTLKLLAHAHRLHGKLKWEELFAPAIALAENGFAVTPRLHMAISTDRFLKNDPTARAHFFDNDGNARAIGSLYKNTDFAATLKTLSREGERAFYSGELTQRMIDAVRAHQNAGDLSVEDFAQYKVVGREPVCGQYRSYKVCGFPPPSSGGIAIVQMLGMLERFDLATLGPTDAQATHLLSEAARLAYADRNKYLADPAFVDIPKQLTSRDYIALRADLIDPRKSMQRATPGDPRKLIPAAQKQAFSSDFSLEFPSTSHISIVDDAGNAVSMTTTIEDTMGARLMVGGFLLNNEMTDFSFVPEENGDPIANRIAPGKRPRSTMAPTVIYDAHGKLFALTGSPGGSAIINYVVKSIVGVIDWKLDPQAAVSLPNIGSRNGPTEIEKDSAAESQVAALRALGHDPKLIEFVSGLHMIVRTPDGWIAGADPRREGTAKGY